MIKVQIVIFFFLFSFCFDCYAQSGELQYYTDFDLALEMATKLNKDVFAYVGHGRTIKEETLDVIFEDEELKQFITDRFVPVRVNDIPKMRFIKRYHYLYYPMFIFYDKGGEELYRVSGQKLERSKNTIIELSEFALTRPYPRMTSFEKNFKRNKNDATYLKDYFLLALKLRNYEVMEKIERQYAKIYLNVPKGEWLDFIFENTFTEKSKLFEILIKHKSDFEEKFGEQKVQTDILKILLYKLKINSNKITLENFIRKFMSKINKYDMVIQDRYLLSVVAYRKYSKSNWGYEIKNDGAKFATKILNSYSESLDDYTITGALWEVAFYVSDEVQLKKYLLMLEQLIEENDDFWRLDCKSVFLYKLGMKDEASRFVDYARNKANETNQKYESTIKNLKRQGLLK